MVYGFSNAESHDWSDMATWGCLLAGVVLTYFLQQSLHYTPVETGLAFLPMVAALMVFSALATSVLIPRLGPKPVVPLGMGLTHPDVAFVRDSLEERSAAGELVLLLNTASDPVIERILTPRVALTVAEHLAFTGGRHVLVVLSDMTSYAEALREVSAARGEIPARRAYPGYLYSDLASLYEHCGKNRGRPGSVTVLPVLTMPAGDITHPVPDLTGYITEGQIVLSRETHARGVYPPVDALSSLSRLMRKGAGPGRTRPDHLDVAAQLLAALARARQIREPADLVGPPRTEAAHPAYPSPAPSPGRTDQCREVARAAGGRGDLVAAGPSPGR